MFTITIFSCVIVIIVSEKCCVRAALYVPIFTIPLNVFMIIVKFLPGVLTSRPSFVSLSGGLYINVKIVARKMSAV